MSTTYIYKGYRAMSTLVIHRWAFVILWRENVRLASPRSSRANVGSTPPLVEVLVVPWFSFRLVRVVRHGAETAEKVRVDKLTGPLPLKVLVVQLIILVEEVQILGEFLRGGEVIHVNVRFIRGDAFVIIRMSTHHDWKHIVSERKKRLWEFYIL